MSARTAPASAEQIVAILQPLYDLALVASLNGPSGWRLAQLIHPRDAADLTVREALALLDQVGIEQNTPAASAVTP